MSRLHIITFPVADWPWLLLMLPEGPVGTLVVSRMDMLEEGYAQRGKMEMPMWVAGRRPNGRSAAQTYSVQQHPLLRYTRHDAQPRDRYSFKPLHAPSLVLRVMVHAGHPVRGARQALADAGCVKMVHLVNLLRSRVEQTANETVELEGWMWPAAGGQA